MIRTLLIICIAALYTAACPAQKKITILHTNDTHSCILPLNKNLANKEVAGRGGYLRRAAMIRDERQATPDLLLFDSGDFSQGSPYYTIFKGDVEIGLMNEMGYDAATIGNHEFDFGLENMARIFRMAKFPIVCANYDFTGTPVEGTVKPYTIIKRNGLKIGIFGIGAQMDGLVDANNCKGVKFLDPITTANATASHLKNDLKCDLVICLSHLGWGIQPPLANDERLIAASHDIDLVLGAHSHTFFKEIEYVNNADGRAIGDDQNGKNAIYVGKLILTMDKKK